MSCSPLTIKYALSIFANTMKFPCFPAQIRYYTVLYILFASFSCKIYSSKSCKSIFIINLSQVPPVWKLLLPPYCHHANNGVLTDTLPPNRFFRIFFTVPIPFVADLIYHFVDSSMYFCHFYHLWYSLQCNIILCICNFHRCINNIASPAKEELIVPGADISSLEINGNNSGLTVNDQKHFLTVFLWISVNIQQWTHAFTNSFSFTTVWTQPSVMLPIAAGNILIVKKISTIKNIVSFMHFTNSIRCQLNHFDLRLHIIATTKQ